MIKFFNNMLIIGGNMIRLFELRQEKELSQRDVAKELFVSQGTYNNWENSKTQPSIEQLILLSKFFNVSIDYIVCNSDEYVSSQNITLSPNQEKILSIFNKLDAEEQNNLISLLDKLTKRPLNK